MRKSKGFLALFCAVALLLSLCGSAFAAEVGVPYTLREADCTTAPNDKGGVTITKVTGLDREATHIIVPATLGGQNVTVFGGGVDERQTVFAPGYYIVSVTLPEGLAEIGAGAFGGCSDLEEVKLPSTLRAIGPMAFAYLFDLTRLTLNEGLKTLGANALNGTGIAELTLPTTLTTLGEYALAGTMLTEVGAAFFPERITAIPSGLFSDCEKLTSAVLPDRVTTLGTSVFSYCDALTTVTLPAELTEIPSSTFSNCPKLTDVIIPGTVTAIGTSAFSQCTMLANITLPTGLTTLGTSAFSGCGALTEIAIPDGITALGYFTFSGCRALSNVTLPANLQSIDLYAFEYCNVLQEITFPASLKTLSRLAFYYTPVLREVTFLGGAPETGGSNPFSQSAATVKVYHPTADSGSFKSWRGKGYENLTLTPIDQRPPDLAPIDTQIILSARLEKDPSNKNTLLWFTVDVTPMHYSKDGFTDETLFPAGAITVTVNEVVQATAHQSGGNNPTHKTFGFELNGLYNPGDELKVQAHLASSIGFNSADSEILTGKVVWPKSAGDQLPFTTEDAAALKPEDLYTFAGDGGTGVVITGLTKYNADWTQFDKVPYALDKKTVTGLGAGVFKDSVNAANITLPYAVTALGEGAFENCANLNSVYLPKGITALPARLFANSPRLSSCTLPNKLQTIGAGAFQNCKNLWEMTFPATLTTIAADAFEGCALSEITFEGNAPTFSIASAKEAFGPETILNIRPGATGFDKAPWKDMRRPPVFLKIPDFSYAVQTADDGAVRLLLDVQFDTGNYTGSDLPKPTPDPSKVKIQISGFVATNVTMVDGKFSIPVESKFFGWSPSVRVSYLGDWYFLESDNNVKTSFHYESVLFPNPKQPVAITNVTSELIENTLWLDPTFNPSAYLDQSSKTPNLLKTDVRLNGVEVDATYQNNKLSVPVTAAPGETVYVAVTFKGDDNFTPAAPYNLAVKLPGGPPDPVKVTPVLTATAGAVGEAGAGYILPLTVDINGNNGGSVPNRTAIEVEVAIGGFSSTHSVTEENPLNILITQDQLGNTASIIVRYPGADPYFFAAEPVTLSNVALDDPTPPPPPIKPLLDVKAGNVRLENGSYLLPLTVVMTADGYTGSNPPNRSTLAVTIGDTNTAYTAGTGDILNVTVVKEQLGTPTAISVSYPGDDRFNPSSFTLENVTLTDPAPVLPPNPDPDPDPAPDPVPDVPSGGSSAPPPKPSAGTDTKVTVSNKDVTAAVKDAADSGNVVLKAEAKEGATSVAVTVPASAMKAIAKAEAPVSIQSPVADLTLDVKVLEALQANGAKDVVVSAGAADTAALPKAARTALEGRPVYDISITAGGKSVSQFGGGNVTVALPYTPAAGEDPSCLAAHWVKEDGTTEVLRNSVYKDGKLTFATPHLSTYAILYTDVAFLDVGTDSWAKTDIEFVTARGILSGMGDGFFGPTVNLTGTMAVVALARMEGIRVGVADADGALAPDWAAPALAWAEKKALLPPGFDPNALLTREAFAYLVTGFLGGAKSVSAPNYLDTPQITLPCMDSVNYLTSQGIMTGTGDGYFSPQIPLTRSELAAVLQRVIVWQMA